MTITAKVIEYSIGPSDQHKPILTIEARYPRFIHAELMTHRVFSRNAASSRAIPTQRLIDDVKNDPAIPVYWGKNQPGMQAREECDEYVVYNNYMGNFVGSREDAWLNAREHAIQSAENFMTAGYHKQIVNRLLEPWAHITVCITSTSWANFFALRDHPDAQPEIRELARAIKEAKYAVKPRRLQYGEWHFPYVTEDDRQNYPIDAQLQMSVARCASTSYRTVDGQLMTAAKALELYKKLIDHDPIHASPTEHQATPDEPWGLSWSSPQLHGNFTGYKQYRKMLPNEYVGD